jgi:hypothetical protein
VESFSFNDSSSVLHQAQKLVSLAIERFIGPNRYGDLDIYSIYNLPSRYCENILRKERQAAISDDMGRRYL